MINLRNFSTAMFAVLATAASFAACAGDAVSISTVNYCSRRCDCEKCTSTERSDCGSELDELGDSAEETNCRDPFITYVDCLSHEAQCANGAYDESACTGDRAELDDCIKNPTCASTKNGICDEPQGTGKCLVGTDTEDCTVPTCALTNNGICDEPQGTGQCPFGTDVNDCNGFMCPFFNNGICDEPQGTGNCPPGSDFNDCNGSTCPFFNNGICDEPQGTGQCPPGTDFNDCATMTCVGCADFVSNGAQGSLCPGSDELFKALFTCTCDGPCQPECGSNLCVDFMPTMECQSCVQGPCGMEFANCANDF